MDAVNPTNGHDDVSRNGYYPETVRRTESLSSWEYQNTEEKESDECPSARIPPQCQDMYSGKQSSEASNDMESSGNDEWHRAPLARPESLSASSSMYSVVSESRKSSFNAKTGRAFRPEGYCYYVDPVESPEEAYGRTFAPAPLSGRNQITTLATIEGTPTHYVGGVTPDYTNKASGLEYVNETPLSTVQSSDSGVITTGEDIPLTVLTRPLPEGSPPPKPPRLQSKSNQDNPKDIPHRSSLPTSPAPTLGRGYTEYMPLIYPDFDDGMFSPIVKDDNAKETDRLTGDERQFVTSTPSVKRNLSKEYQGLKDYQGLKETKC
uniref:Uncharacterized protein LOC102801600 n=1 Tax=Saccoglossus kowalevskii TaxID=10224 RepID=A0ABM0MAW7_SACKO|nr:PREDICTED: uncharacterized protein LOC102801600 [Saccoglossus kowalevskii]